MTFSRISVTQCKEIIAKGEVTIVDVRDSQSYEAAHIEEASFLDDSNVAEFVESADKAIPLIVYCYHGNTSQGAASYFNEQGFEEVYSMDGGFEEWRTSS